MIRNIIPVLFIALLVSFTGCKKASSPVSKPSVEAPKSQYEAEWIEIEEMEKKDLGKSIIEKVNLILEDALEKENTTQVFKALAYRSKYENRIEEESTFKILSHFENQIEKSHFPLKQLLHSATAELYFQYYNQNRWRFNQRTSTNDFKPEDLRTWSLQDILNKISTHYKASLDSKNELNQIPVKTFANILTTVEAEPEKAIFSGKELRPSIYDFLLDRALSHFKRNEGNISQPIHEFSVDNFPIFSSVNDFTSISFNSPDTNSNQFISSNLYSEVLSAHSEDKDKKVLIDFNLDRLRYFYHQSKNDLKDSLYLSALKKLSNEYLESSSIAEIDYQIADLYKQWGFKYAPKSGVKANRWYLKQAREIALKHSDSKSFGGYKCKNLLQQIERSYFNFTTEKVYLPNEAILYRFEYKNIDSIYLRLVKIPHELGKVQRYRDEEEFVKGLLRYTPVKEWNENIPNPKDFQQHSLELYFDGLEKGKYALMVCKEKSFNAKLSIATSVFSISNLSYISKKNDSGEKLLVNVLNRTTGQGIAKAKLSVFISEYDYQSRKNQLYNVGDYYTKEDGSLELNQNKENRSILLVVTKDNDTLNESNNFYLRKYRQSNKRFIKTHFFTDRAIYRPGQTVYFKGILIESNQNRNKPKPNYASEVILLNVNGEELKTLKVRTNAYGSYQGSFVLPASGLNGQYRIRDKHGMHFFSVEEYKRPSFKLELDTSNATQKINTTVLLSGNAKAFSGANISDALLNYRVIRRATYPYWSYLRSFMPPVNQKEIANGKTSTDGDGNFTFSFFAKADPTVNRNWKPVYNYEVIIDVTSANGETQGLEKTIQLSEQSLFLTANIDEAIQLKELKDLIVKAKNINGKSIESKAQLKLWKLKTPKKAKKSKFWADIDQTSMTDKKYQNLFPNYPTSKTAISSFEREVMLTSGAIECNKKLNLFNAIQTGAYELEISATDSYGSDVILKKRFILFDENAKQLPYPQFSWIEALINKGEPGETAEFLIGSSLNQLRLLYEVEFDKKIVSKQYLTLSNEQKKISIPIKENYRGNFYIHFTGVHSNRTIRFTERIAVPYSNKKLKLELGTFRNLVEPGSKEKWTMTITGSNGEGLASELLAGMYDQSLDQFKKKDWNLSLYQNKYSNKRWQEDAGFNSSRSRLRNRTYDQLTQPSRNYPSLNWFGFNIGHRRYDGRAMPMMMSNAISKNFEIIEDEEIESDMPEVFGSYRAEDGLTRKMPDKPKEEELVSQSNPIRTDFRETVFFYPQLRTDNTGKISFEFTMPEALTQWKFRALAHTKDLKIGKLEQSIRTQKKLMVSPNVPRFFREGDQLVFKIVINNLSKEPQKGFAKLHFIDTFSGDKIDISDGPSADIPFNIEAGKNTTKSWKIKIPENLKAITYRVEVKSQNFSDGEEKSIPVLLNRMLLTESLPLAIRGKQSKSFQFEKLLTNASTSLTHESFTVEFTPNPAWYAIQALPYVSEGQSECSEQVFARLYANAIAEKIANNHPRIKAIFETWKQLNSVELSSKLMQNQELKSILIEETPWLRQAKSESEQKKRIALLFDYNKMSQEKKAAIAKLKQLQLPNGGWSWYKGMRDSRYITQYIVNGFGHLKKLGVELEKDQDLNKMLNQAIDYLDQRVIEDYALLKKHKADLSKNHLSQLQIHYLYTRSFFTNHSLPKDTTAYNYYLKQASKYWTDRSIYMKGMIALVLDRLQTSSPIPSQIIASLKDNSIQSEELGMYWKANSNGYYWYNSSVETQALMVELFNDVAKDQKSVDELRIWLLKQKQTQMWSNSKATALACYALLMDNAKAFNRPNKISIRVANNLLKPKLSEAGTSYFKKKWNASDVKSEMGNISLTKKDEGIAWGAAYWQYYEDLDKITSAAVGELSISKKLFKVGLNASGEFMIPIETSEIKIGDKIRVRLRIESKRKLEFVHLKDMRASGFEPTKVISRYNYQDGLGYYESTKDASTNFFMDRLNKGVYVFEYDLRATISGNFSNGISSIQCQYAPEFAAHSKGKNVQIK